MPKIKSAKKALRQNKAHHTKNLVQKKALKTLVREYRKKPSAELLPQLYKKLDKAAKVNLIKKNTASRLKSRLTQLIAKSNKAVS